MSKPASISVVKPAANFPLRLLSDERLARLAARGDERAFEQIFSRHRNELYRYCRGILSQHEDAQDALQATMASALRSLPGENREIKLRPWLYRVAHNEAISILRQRRTASPDAFTPELSPSAAAVSESRERLRQLVADLDTLPERQRGALTMRELSGMSYAEVGEALDVSPAAARQAVYEARTSLQMLGEGREMECEQVRLAISERDGRILRGRKLRSHIRGCDGCLGFEASIMQRRADFKILSPVLPGAAGAGLLASLLGGEAARTVATSGAVKALAAIGAAAAIGTGAAGFSGAIHIPGLGGTSHRDAAGTPAQQGPASAGGERDAAAGQTAPGARGGAAGAPGTSTAKSAAGKRASFGKRSGGSSADSSDGSSHSGAGKTGSELPASAQGTPPANSSAGGNSAANSAGSNAGGNSATNSAGSNAGGNSATNSAGSNSGGSSATNSASSNAGGNSATNSASSNSGRSSATNSSGSNIGGNSAAHSQASEYSNSPAHTK